MPNFKPLRDYSEHDVINLFKLNTATGSKATPVVISNSGWNTSVALPKVFSNLANGQNNGNTYSPRWEIYPAVRAAASGEKPLGLTLYDTREVNFLGYPLLYDKQRRDELQAVVSGQAVPIVRKGLFHLGPFSTGDQNDPAPGKFLAIGTGGQFAVVNSRLSASGTTSGLAGTTGVSGIAIPGTGLPVFGEFMGGLDADGYALCYINCYRT